MAQAIKPTALVVENDEMQRTLVSTLLEESEMNVIQCESAEAAVYVLDQSGGCLSIIFTDVELAGIMDGIELSHIARQRFPDLHIIVTSGMPRIKTPSRWDNLHGKALECDRYSARGTEIASLIVLLAVECARHRPYRRRIPGFPAHPDPSPGSHPPMPSASLLP